MSGQPPNPPVTGQSDRAASKPFQASEILRASIRASLQYALKVLSPTRESSLVWTSLPKGHGQASLAIRTHQGIPYGWSLCTEAQLVAMTMNQSLTMMVNCSWLRNRATTFFPRLKFLEQKISGQVKSSQLLHVPILVGKSGSKTPHHTQPLTTTIQVTETLLCEQAQVCTAVVLIQKLHCLTNFKNSTSF